MVNIGWKKTATGDNPWESGMEPHDPLLIGFRHKQKKERSKPDSTPKYDMKQYIYSVMIPTLELEFRTLLIVTTKSSQGTFWCANT